jgi:NACalpha-BTF3-like transcription factor
MQTQRQVDERTLEVLKQARSKDLAGDIARRASISALEARLASTQPESSGSVLQGDMSADDVALMARQVGYPISHPEWRKATEEFAALLAAAILRASPAEPKAPASDDPHRDHWVAIAETSQRIAASKECGPAEAASFCAAIERLSSALEKSDERASPAEPLQEPAQPRELCGWGGWLFKRNSDGTIGITAPPPKPGESRRTSDCVGPQDRDLHELLGKLADHMTALADPVQEQGFWGRIAARQATRIKRLETTGQQALEALRCVDLQSLVPDYGSGHYSVARLDGPQVKSAITAMEAALAEPGTVVRPESPEVQVRAIASEIIDALNADEQDGGYDLTGGLFGARFSALVRRWAALESAETQSWQQLIALRSAISEIAQGCERRLRKGFDAGDDATLRICRQAMEDLGQFAAAPPKPLIASDIESAIGYRIPQHSMELLLRLIQEREEVTRGLHAESGRPRGIVPEVLEDIEATQRPPRESTR